jgi:hypothetical protein
MMDVVKTAGGVVALLVAVSTAVYAGINELRSIEIRSDAKYVPLSEWQDFQWSQLRKELRQIEKDIAEAEFEGNDRFAEKLQDEYDELLEYLCRVYPEDRSC